MRIHLITNLFYPDQLAGASLFTDFAKYFSSKGHDIRVTTTFSYYPEWQRKPEDLGVKQREEVCFNIPVKRLSMFIPKRPSGLKRILSEFSFLASLIRHSRFDNWTPEVIVTASPMFSQCLGLPLFYRKKIPKLVIIQDFAVDAAFELGILKHQAFKKLLLKVERYAYGKADVLTTISEEMKLKLLGKVDHDKRVSYIPNWIHESLETQIKEISQSPLKRAQGKLFYSGNIGIKQGLPQFLETFKKLKSDWKLFIQGGGADYENLKAKIANCGNVELRKTSDERAYMASLKECTACLITQKPGIGANFLPSKILPALATGTPILAACDPKSPLGIEVTKGEFGEVVPIDDPKYLEGILNDWSKNPAKMEQYSQNAIKRSQFYSRSRVLGIFESELENLVKGV